MREISRRRVLYILREDVREPLISSQVFGYLRGLKGDFSFTVLDLKKRELDGKECLSNARIFDDIKYKSGRFRRRTRVVAGAMNFIDLLVRSCFLVRADKIHLVHARSYLPSAVAWLLFRFLGVPYVFDMRALWPEELIVGGKIKRNSPLHRCLKVSERVLLRDAAGVVSLTEAAVEHLSNTYPGILSATPTVVIPTCADLTRFNVSPTKPDQFVCSCVGSLLSGWFELEWLREWIEVLFEKDPSANFEILTRDDPDAIRAVLDPAGCFGDRVHISARSPAEMPAALKNHSASVMFFSQGVGKLGSSPTRMGEILGTGLPVIANAGVGDVADIILENRVGVVVEGKSRRQMGDAYDSLHRLMQDPRLGERCRATAEAIFSLHEGTERYRSLYQSIFEDRNE
jgi:glycosyltransferase involved in cell wall biosynthesis